MKRNTLIIWFAFFALIAVNALLFLNIYKLQINQQKNLLFRETEVCSQEIERVVRRFESDLNYILFSDDISDLFTKEESDGLRKLQFFYSTYHNLIKNIDIYDNEKNVLNVFRDRKNNFITDRYIGQRQRKLINREEVIMHNSNYQYVLPVFKNNELFANVLVTINLNKYILSELEKFYMEGYSWQWVADLDNQKIYNAQNFEFTNFEGSEDMIANLANDMEGLTIHTISNDSIKYKLLSVYSPITVLNKKFGIAMSVDYKLFLNKVFSKLTFIAIICLLIFISVSIFLSLQIKALKKKMKD